MVHEILKYGKYFYFDGEDGKQYSQTPLKSQKCLENIL